MGNSSKQDKWRFAEGDQITDELIAMRLLGGGSAYEAYLAFDEITYAPVVVKLVRPDQVENETTLRGLRREVDALAKVNHPVVVRGLRHVADGDRPHIVLEQLDGPRLSTLIRRYGPLQPQQYLPLGIEIASALHYFNYLGMVHLDIKPSNIIMGAPARLIDLSVMRTIEATEKLSYTIGTDAYLAPEQADPPHTGTPGPASDVWGLGATLFHAVAGERAFAEGDPKADDPRARFPQLTDAPGPLPARTPHEVAKIVLSCLDPDPASRPTPAEIAEGMQPILEAMPRGRLTGFKVK